MMGNITFADHAETKKLIAEKCKIVLALVAYDCLAKFQEFADEADFLKLLKTAGAEVSIMSRDQFAEHCWWATAFLFARRNQIDVIDREFCRRFDADVHHAPTLAWSEKYLSDLPSRYAEMLGSGR